MLLSQILDTSQGRAACLPIAVPVVLAALLGIAWQVGHWGPILSLILIPLVVMGGTRKDRYGVALAYYLAGSHGLIEGSASFFGPGHVPMGVALWLASSALLAAGWAFADRPWRVVAVLVVDALPPLGLFDWLSPLASAGVLFPGSSWIGLPGLLLCIWLFARWMAQGFQATPYADGLLLAGLASVSINVGTLINPPAPPAGWMGINLHLGPITGNLLADMNRNQDWIRQTQGKAMQAHAKVVLLPETLTTWWAGNAAEIKASVPSGQTWLVGASVPVGRDLLADGIEAVHGSGGEGVEGKENGDDVRNHREAGRLLFISPFPVPVSMWHPWYRGHGYVRADGVGYKAGWWEPVRKVHGIRAWASICYDQLLPWVWMEAVAQHPQVILLTNNEWWAKGTGIPEIQRATAWGWTRLIGAATVEAENA